MNNVCLVGRLVRDPELRHSPSGTAVCSMRVAVDRAGDKTDDGYGAGFFDVTCFDRQAENCAQYLAKGREVAVSGSLRFREWEDKDTGKKRNAVEIIAYSVTFIGGRGDTDATSTSSDDDIPF